MNDSTNETLDTIIITPNITDLVIREIVSFQTSWSNFHLLYEKQNNGIFLFIYILFYIFINININIFIGNSIYGGTSNNDNDFSKYKCPLCNVEYKTKIEYENHCEKQEHLNRKENVNKNDYLSMIPSCTTLSSYRCNCLLFSKSRGTNCRSLCHSELDLFNHTREKHPEIGNSDIEKFKELIIPNQMIIHCNICCSDCKNDRDDWYSHLRSVKHMLKLFEYEKLLQHKTSTVNINYDQTRNKNKHVIVKELRTFDYALTTDKFDVFTIIITKNPSPSLLVSFQFLVNRCKIKSFKRDPSPGPVELTQCVRVGDDLLGCQGINDILYLCI
jgi:hypothetical protein